MLMKKEPDSQDNTRPDDLNNYKLHLCICEKPIYFVFLQMLSARGAGKLYEKSWAIRVEHYILKGVTLRFVFG